MRVLSLTLAAALAAGFLAACSHGASTPSPALPVVDEPSRRVQPAATATPVYLYVADKGSNAVTVYDHKLTYVSTPPFEGVSEPVSITFDSNEDLYVANSKSSTVTEYSKDSHGRMQSSPFQTIKGGDISNPVGVAIDPTGHIYVASAGTNEVAIYSSSGVGQQNLEGSAYKMGKPVSIGYNDGYLYVGNLGTASVSGDGLTICSGTPPHVACNLRMTTAGPSSVIRNPKVLAFDSSHNIYVTNDESLADGGSVTEYCSPSCKTPPGPWGYIQTWGLDAVSLPDALAFQKGNLCIASYGNSEVICYTTPGAIYDTLTSACNVDHPTSLAVGLESDYLKVANYVSSTTGTLTQYPPKGTCPSAPTTTNVSGPVSIAIGPAPPTPTPAPLMKP
jgi:hypothetical protein